VVSERCWEVKAGETAGVEGMIREDTSIEDWETGSLDIYKKAFLLQECREEHNSISIRISISITTSATKH
jgi:hypothetical protein